MDPLLQEVLQAVQLSYGNLGLLAAVGTALMYAVRIYRGEALQAKLPAKVRWDALPSWAKVALPFGLAFLGAGAVALAGSAAPLSAAFAGLMSGLSAIGLHHLTKLLGGLIPADKPVVNQALVEQAIRLTLPAAKNAATPK